VDAVLLLLELQQQVLCVVSCELLRIVALRGLCRDAASDSWRHDCCNGATTCALTRESLLCVVAVVCGCYGHVW
jgi:hypothetical protein